MPSLMSFLRMLPLAATLALAACVNPGGPPPPAPDEVARLEQAILAMGPAVDPDEAARAARIAYDYPRELAVRYGVTDAPLIHNTKVNMGLRDRGLCFQWADDIEARLAQEGFQSLEMHRAIANGDNALIDHSVVILSRRGGTMYDGLVLDGWRDSGRLFWSPTLQDRRYTWVARDEVFARREARSR